MKKSNKAIIEIRNLLDKDLNTDRVWDYVKKEENFPEDLIPERTSWDELLRYSNDMSYTLKKIYNILEGTPDFNSIFKFNNGNGAILCSECGEILKTGWCFDDIEKKYLNNKDDESLVILNKRIEDGEYLCDDCKIEKFPEDLVPERTSWLDNL